MIDINDPDINDPDYYNRLYDDKAPVAFRISKATQLSLNVISNKWDDFCRYRSKQPYAGDFTEALRNIEFKEIKIYMHWYLDHHKCTKLDTVLVHFRFWRMLYAHHLGYRIASASASQIRNYALREDGRDKDVLSLDDLYNVYNQFWCRSVAHYNTERNRAQHALVMLLIAYISTRPSTLLLTKAYKCSDNSLRSKDIVILIVRDPSARAIRPMFLMRIKLRLFKGKRNAGLAPIFVFHEPDDDLAFCPILQVLALAFADEAFASEYIQTLIVLDRIRVPSYFQCVPLEWKDEWKGRPIFRKALKAAEGGYVTAADKALPYLHVMA